MRTMTIEEAMDKICPIRSGSGKAIVCLVDECMWWKYATVTTYKGRMYYLPPAEEDKTRGRCGAYGG